MPTIDQFVKRPADRQDYDINFGPYLAPFSPPDTLSGAPAVVAAAGITLEAVAVSDSVVKVWLSGGTADTTYPIKCTVTTSGGRVLETEIAVLVGAGLRFNDAFLSKHCTSEREVRAFEHIDDLGLASLPAQTRDRLATIKCYMIVCMECCASEGDLFAEKLKHYRREFDDLLAQARASIPAPDGSARGVFCIPLERG